MDYFEGKYIKSSVKISINLLCEQNTNTKKYIRKKKRIIEYAMKTFYNDNQNLDKPKRLRDRINSFNAEKSARDYVNQLIVEKMFLKYPAIKEE